MQFINDEALLRLNMHILATEYLEKGSSCFTKVTRNNEEINKYDKKAEIFSNSENKTKNKGFM